MLYELGRHTYSFNLEELAPMPEYAKKYGKKIMYLPDNRTFY